MLTRSCLVFLLLLLTSSVSLAFEVGHGDDWKLTISGFGTLGAVYSTNQNAGYLRDVTQAHGASGFSVNTDTRFGLQTNFKWQEIELVTQAVSRHRADNTYTPELQKKAFYEQLVHKSLPEIQAYWARLLFTGEATPPQQTDNMEEALKMVSHNQGAIAYIDRSQINSSVIVVYDFNADSQ